MLKRPFTIGNLQLASNVFCAPLAGCSDLPFRRVLASYKPGLMFCEMVKMDALVRHDPGTYHLLDFEKDMHPIGAQLCGSKPALAGPAAKICEDLGFDLIDLNCGCPVDKVTKDGSGSALLKTKERIGEIISAMVASVKVPVTIKIRIGWDSEQINCMEICRIAQESGASAVCIHGRTRAQGYAGPADWSHIKACKEAFPNFCIIGNGDIFSVEAVRKIFAETGCDGIMLSRGILGTPWLVEDIYRDFFSTEQGGKKKGVEYYECLKRHLEYIVSYQPERRALLDMRRVGCWYLKQAPGTKKLREALNLSKETEEVFRLVEQHPWQEV